MLIGMMIPCLPAAAQEKPSAPRGSASGSKGSGAVRAIGRI